MIKIIHNSSLIINKKTVQYASLRAEDGLNLNLNNSNEKVKTKKEIRIT